MKVICKMQCRLFDMGVTLQQGNMSAQSLVFHPWQASTPDANISNVNANAVISSGGVTDNVSGASLQYRLLSNSSSARGINSLNMFMLSTILSLPEQAICIQCQTCMSSIMCGLIKQTYRRSALLTPNGSKYSCCTLTVQDTC